MLTFNTYIKTLQKYADNINVSNEAFFRTFFEYIVDKLDILTLDNEPYDFTKQRISALLNQKEDFSFKIRDAICHYTAKEKLLEIFPDIVNDLLNKQRLPALINDIKQLVIDDNSLSEEFKKEIQCSSNNEVLVNCFIQAIKVSNLQTKKQKTLWKSGNNFLKYVTGNLIDTSFNNKKDNKKIVVIPVNTSFETKLSNNIETELYPLVSENTIHGQWLKKILNIIKKEDLDKRIQSQLANKQIKPTGKSKGIGGKQVTYPIGTTAIIQHKNTMFYLLAISEFDEKNNAQSSKNEIKNSIINLLENYETYGQGYEMLIPLIGTGKSRANLSPKVSYNLIKDTIIENQKLVNGQIKIVILENTLGEIFNDI